MKRFVLRFSDRGLVQTFFTGLFVLLPLVLRLALMSWAGTWLSEHIEPDNAAGQTLRSIGLRFLANEAFATVAS